TASARGPQHRSTPNLIPVDFVHISDAANTHVGHIMVERAGSLGDIDLAAFSEHLGTCRCPRAKGGRRIHHAI
ncbi:MAG: hypothetical protein J2P50_12815, partial [Hyphomicrobiaceae bacterium]|nr:hypothetical protein [Hyphomicrobiaceae bacterium]